MLCAITAVARKLASILHRMWVSETDFHVGFGEDHAAAAVETGAVVAVQVTTDQRWAYARHVEEERHLRSARAVSVPWRGRETGTVRYLACCRPSGTRAPETALFTNLMKSMRRPKC